MAKPQKSTAQSEVPGLVKKGPLYYLKRDWQLYALMLLPMVFIIVFKYFAYTGLRCSLHGTSCKAYLPTTNKRVSVL